MPGNQGRIRWAPKLRPDKLIRLYEDNAAGMLDEELLDDVAWTLYFRVRDVVRVSSSRVVCPHCTTEFEVRWRGEDPQTTSTCPTCDWTTTAGTYHRSWEHQDLNGHSDEFAYYLDHFPQARSPQQRMLLIDRLVHALHVAAVEGSVANFAARNFLEGNRPKIAALLDQLAYGSASTVDPAARARWQAPRASCGVIGLFDILGNESLFPRLAGQDCGRS